MNLIKKEYTNSAMTLPAIAPAIQISTRINQRKYIKQAVPIADKLQLVVDSFAHAVECAPKQIPYSVIYDHYKQEWDNTVKDSIRLKYKAVKINESFFELNYKPTL